MYRIRFNSKLLFNIVMISKTFLSTISSINHFFIEHKEINRKDETINLYYLVYFRARRAFRKIIQQKKILFVLYYGNVSFPRITIFSKIIFDVD